MSDFRGVVRARQLVIAEPQLLDKVANRERVSRMSAEETVA
ncbi:hypothetical protein GCM10012275_46950 [Longimycelium tulufanense]|uniref:Uncharacterized protein n=1 Tax=Longimycelium tulufanense TaxID=907463 RepID=A0A8J3CFE5_9PSEU|nr:hypothetical protein [Longimycelium tulufanense]GGM71096.1 hypothetical protein GCM10012275_46950 [Longimycelium tulufanense]